MDKSTAEDHKWKPGQALTVEYERGKAHPLTLQGTYTDNGLAGQVLVHETERSFFEERLDGVVLVKDADGVSQSQARAVLASVVKDYPSIEVLTKDEFIGEVSGFVDFIIAFLTAMLLLSVLIALVGVVNTLALSVSERTRELGLLRAVGLSRRQTRRMIRVEGVVVALYGSVLGLIVGTVLGIAITKALEDQGVQTLTLPWGSMIVFLVFGALIGVLAAILPARRAARMDVLKAIATE